MVTGNSQGFHVIAEKPQVAFGATPLLAHNAVESRFARPAITGVAEFPVRLEIVVEMSFSHGRINVGEPSLHCGERLRRACTHRIPGQERFNAKPNRLDFFQFVERKGGDAGAAARRQDHQSLPLQPT